MNSQLTLAAQRQAAYVSTIGRLDHADANGGQAWDRIEAAGYNWSTVGENLAFSTNPTHIFNLWMNSPGHHKNIVNPAFNEVGFGKVTAGGGEYWCAVFAHH
jgi:uncharacterized protein YkwD